MLSLLTRRFGRRRAAVSGALLLLAMTFVTLGRQAMAQETPRPAPTVTSFSPASGRFPNFVTITGTNFTGATQVSINGITSAKITVVSPTQITALIRSIAYTEPITVTTMRGTATSAGTFTVIPMN